MTVTAAFLVKDPPLDRLALLLAYLRPVVGEVVIVVDDRTWPATAATMAAWPGVKLVPFAWCDDFSAARNAALPHCTGDWILHLDPDELPSAAMLDFIRTVDAEPQVDVEWQDVTYHAPRGWLFFTRNWFDGVQAPELEEHWHCRLFRRTAGRWYKRIHEQIALEGFPEEETRGTPGLPKAPLAAHLLHSRMNDAAIDAAYARIEGA
jgi:glycosyltransferase involved in cell wall biosynthesis